MKRIFVGNVDFSTTKAELRSLFQPYGTVERISLVTARDTGQSCACGFIEMRDSTEGETAIAALNGKNSRGRSLIVLEAPQNVKDPGGPNRVGCNESRDKAPRGPR